MLFPFKLTLRRIAKSPGFTAIALATLAICIGANLSIFAVLDAVLLRPLPFPGVDRLVTIFNSYPKAGVERGGASVTNYYERRGNIPALSSTSAYRDDYANVGEGKSVNREELFRITPEFFDTLGVRPTLGREFDDREMVPASSDVAILTDAYWKQHYGGDPRALGREVRVNGVAKTIVGILPKGLRFLSSGPRIFLPLATNPEERAIDARYRGNAQMIARLRPGYDVSAAQSQIDAHNSAHAAEYPYSKELAAAGFRSFVYPLQTDYVRRARPLLLLLQGGALLLLAIGGVNIVNLLLVRASDREREYAIRQSLGAGTQDIACDVFAETITLAAMGGVLGLLLGCFGIRTLGFIGAGELPLGSEIQIDGRIAFAALASTIVLGAAIAIPIIWFNLKNHLAETLRSGSRMGTHGPEVQRFRNGLIVAQIALAFVLLAGTGLLEVSLKKAMDVNPGFRPDHVLTGEILLPWESYRDNPARLAFAERLLEKVQHLPGIDSVGIATSLPLEGMSNTDNVFVVGQPPKPGEPPNIDNTFGVIGDYFTAMGIPLKEGRVLNVDDSHRKNRVCVVDESFAHRHWPTGSAIGERFYEGLPGKNPAEAFTIVGVVGSVKQDSLTEDRALDSIYFPFALQASNVALVARAGMSPDVLAVSLRTSVQDIDGDLPIHDLVTMDTRVSNSLVARRSPLLLCGVFALVSLLLAGIGTYGVLAYAVAERHKEIGIRIALGARPAEITRLFLYLGLRQLAIGGALGIIGAAALLRLLDNFLFGVPSFPFTTLLSTSLILALVSLAACLIPSRRAANISPMEAMRSD
ncbi:MAG TPA: ABC transporter permease [Opitutaceae bacterium]